MSGTVIFHTGAVQVYVSGILQIKVNNLAVRNRSGDTVTGGLVARHCRYHKEEISLSK